MATTFLEEARPLGPLFAIVGIAMGAAWLTGIGVTLMAMRERGMNDDILDLDDVCRTLNVSKTRIHELRKQPGFPKAVYTGAQTPMWLKSRIIRWMNEQHDAAEAEAG